MIGIQVKTTISKKWMGFDYKAGVPTDRIIYATLWSNEDKKHVQTLVDFMNEHNAGMSFRIINRGNK